MKNTRSKSSQSIKSSNVHEKQSGVSSVLNTQQKMSNMSNMSKSSEIKENCTDESVEFERTRLTSSEPINKMRNNQTNIGSTAINQNNQNNQNKPNIPVTLNNTQNTSDQLEVSRYPFDPIDIIITKIQEMKLQQKLLKELKFVMSLDERILKNQQYYWLFTNNITNEDARLRIQSALELYCMLRVRWVSGTELEIDINPEHKIEKIPTHKKKT